MRLSASTVLLLLFAALVVSTAPHAWAHGGNFKAGSGPGLGPPPTPGVPGVPVGPPTITPPSTRPRASRLPNRATWTPGDWQVWWQLNVEAHLPVHGEREDVRGVTTPSDSMFRMGPVRVGPNEPVHDPRMERWVSGAALPYLLGLLQPNGRTPEPLIATALIAVGRIAREDPPLSLIRRWVKDEKASLEVRESATLALGLLRRTERERQLSVEQLARTRDFLFEVFDDEDQSTRVRSFALYSMALLADQPYGACAIECDGRLVTRGLWFRLGKKYASQDLTIALLTALGNQPPRGVPSSIRDALRSLARGKPVFRRKWDAMERSHALLAYARLGGPAVSDALLHTLRYTGEHNALQCAALIGLSIRAESMTPHERANAILTIRKLTARDRHWLVRGLAHKTMGTLLGADMREGSHEVLDRTDVLRYLLAQSRKGKTNTRPYSTLGLGLAAHRVQRGSRPIAHALRQIREQLAWGIEHARGSDRVVGAYAVAAGLAEAECARGLLLEVLNDSGRSHVLRGHAALALGQLGRPTQETVDALMVATRDRVSAFIHEQAVRALSLLQAEGVVDELVSQMKGKKTSRPALAAVAGALGRVKDVDAVPKLLDLAQDREAMLYIRVMSVMALGLTFDPEPRPSRVRLTTNANFPAMTWSLMQVFNIM